MNWTKITDNQRVITLLKKRQKIEEEIKAIDETALIMYELEVLSIPVGQSERIMEWKSIEKDGLPKKKYGRFIVNVYEDDEHGDFVMEATFVDGIFLANGMVSIANIVTHWMEMPEPPKR